MPCGHGADDNAKRSDLSCSRGADDDNAKGSDRASAVLGAESPCGRCADVGDNVEGCSVLITHFNEDDLTDE